MDPYLEGEMWQEFHETLASAIRAQLMPRLRPKYVALLAKRYLVARPALSLVDLPARMVYPDVHVVTPPEALPMPSAYGGATAVAEPAVELRNTLATGIPQLSLEIRDVAHRLLVTVVEILSPINKRGEGAKDYEARRHAYLNMRTHLLEIDLLRRGIRIAFDEDEEPPEAPYYIYLSRWQRRPIVEVWPLSLRLSLPVVPVPLLPEDPDIPLDMQAAVQACFELVGYEVLLDYTKSPPSPALTAEDASWADALLRTAGYRATSE
jgi:hypothetical protein